MRLAMAFAAGGEAGENGGLMRLHMATAAVRDGAVRPGMTFGAAELAVLAAAGGEHRADFAMAGETERRGDLRGDNDSKGTVRRMTLLAGGAARVG